MIVPAKILENKTVILFLKKRNLLKQYKTSKEIILKWIFWKTKFWEKMPKWKNIRYFRINKQFRTIWSLDEKNILRIFEIDNHQ